MISALAYTLLWGVLALAAWALFASAGKTFIWALDGVYQHFMAFNVVCQSLDELVSTGSMAHFNFSLGLGADTLATLSSYDFADPLNWIAALLPLGRVQSYEALMWTKCYLAGAFFIVLCWCSDKHDVAAVVGGALAYAFSGTVLIYAMGHPNFVSWTYCLPLILAGFVRYRSKQAPSLLVAAIALNAFTNFYTLYIDCCLFAIIVIVVAICNIALNRTGRACLAEIELCFKVLGYCLLGLALAAVVLLPTIYAFLGGTRVAELTGYSDSAFMYPEGFLGYVLSTAFTHFSGIGLYGTTLGMNFVMFVPFVLLFCTRGNAPLKVLLVLFVVLMFIPLAGRAFNGFGYATNRWTFVIPLLVSFAFVEVFPQLLNPTAKQKLAVGLALCIYLVVTIIQPGVVQDPWKTIPLFLVALVTVMYLILVSVSWRQVQRALPLTMVVLVFASGVYTTLTTFSPGDIGFSRVMSDREGFVEKKLDTSALAVADGSDGFWRVERFETSKANSDVANDVCGTSYWWSIMPASMYEYYEALGVADVSQNCNVKSLDGRPGLMALAGVRYFTCVADRFDDAYVPLGFDEIESRDGRYRAFMNSNWMGVGCTYSGVLSQQDFDELDSIGREQALLQGALLESPLPGFPEIAPAIEEHQLDFELIETDGVEINGKSIVCTRKNGCLHLSVTIPDGYQAYVRIDKPILGQGIGNVVYVFAPDSAGKIEASFARLANLSDQWPALREEVVFNVGRADGHEVRDIYLYVDNPSTLSYDSFEVVGVPDNAYQQPLDALGTYTLEHVEVGNDCVSGVITVPSDRILQLSIPYSAGWSAKVDGQPTELVRSDVAFMALSLNTGQHAVELTYKTPLLFEGCVVSLLALLTCVVLGIRGCFCAKNAIGISADQMAPKA